MKLIWVIWSRPLLDPNDDQYFEEPVMYYGIEEGRIIIKQKADIHYSDDNIYIK